MGRHMGRRELREQIFKLLFRVEFNDRDEMAQQEQWFFEDDEHEMSDSDEEYISKKSRNILERLDEIDDMINKHAKGWTTERMGKVDVTILRLAVYEIVFDDDVPASVAINEAVELAKRFGQDGSPSFVNGVLSKFMPAKA